MSAALRCEIFPSDLDATVDFYVQVLAFRVIRDERAAKHPYVALERGDVRLGAAARDEPRDREPRRPPTGVELVLEVDDLEADREREAGTTGGSPAVIHDGCSAARSSIRAAGPNSVSVSPTWTNPTLR